MGANGNRKFTAARAARIVEHVRSGLFRYNGAELEGISVKTMEGWVSRGKDNLDQLEREIDDPPEGPRARIDAYGRFVASLMAAEAQAEQGVVGVIHQMATDCVDPAVRLRAATWYLERKNNLRYGRGALRVDLAAGEGGEDEADNAVVVVLGRLSQIERRLTPPAQAPDGSPSADQ